jgi:hypothetical protein
VAAQRGVAPGDEGDYREAGGAVADDSKHGAGQRGDHARLQSAVQFGTVREVGEEDNLLIEAVSLLVQRQRETESWIAEQISQAEERAAASERRTAELEVRLAGIEEHLARLVPEVEPVREDAGVDERLERLREQVEGLKSGADTRTARTSPVSPPAPAGVAAMRTRSVSSSGQGVSLWQVFGSSPQDRFGSILIGAGALAVLYAILTQLRFG